MRSYETKQSGEVDKNKRIKEFLKRTLGTSLMLSVILSALATYEANKNDKGSPEDYQLNNEGHVKYVDADLGTYDVVPGVGKVELPGGMLEFGEKDTQVRVVQQAPQYKEVTVTHEQTVQGQNVQLMEWARQFEADPNAVEPRGPEAIAATADTIQQLIDEGWTIEGVGFQGFASDEDDYAIEHGGNNPGFGIESQKNVKLADKRAGAVEVLVAKELANKMGPESEGVIQKFNVIGGQEVVDPALASQIYDVADDLEMNPVDLVMQYNRDPQSLPAWAQETLNGLQNDRYVKIVISVSKEEKVSVPITAGTSEIQTTTSEKRKVIVFIPVLIPIFKRRQKSAEGDFAVGRPNGGGTFDPEGGIGGGSSEREVPGSDIPLEPVIIPEVPKPFVYRPGKDALFREISSNGHGGFKPDRGYKNKQPTHANNGTSKIQDTYAGRMNRRGR